MAETSHIGWGIDAHRFTDTGPLIICGVKVSEERGVAATSDGDVGAHAIADALLGAAALGDLGAYFDSDDPQWSGASSSMILERVVALCRASDLEPAGVDVTIVAQTVRIAPHRESMRTEMATTLGLDVGRVSVKATTTDGLGFTGRDEGIAAFAVATLQPVSA